jgi:hypothetical protein
MYVPGSTPMPSGTTDDETTPVYTPDAAGTIPPPHTRSQQQCVTSLAVPSLAALKLSWQNQH